MNDGMNEFDDQCGYDCDVISFNLIGPLVIQSSNIKTLNSFAGLRQINSDGVIFSVVNGKQYSLVITGMILAIFDNYIRIIAHQLIIR